MSCRRDFGLKDSQWQEFERESTRRVSVIAGLDRDLLFRSLAKQAPVSWGFILTCERALQRLC